MDEGDADKGPGPWGIGFVHSFGYSAAARGARVNTLTLIIPASVRLVRAVQRLASEKGSSRLVAVRLEGFR